MAVTLLVFSDSPPTRHLSWGEIVRTGCILMLAMLFSFPAWADQICDGKPAKFGLVGQRKCAPVNGPLTTYAPGCAESYFGAPREGGRQHRGVDISATVGTAVGAAARGKVRGLGFEKRMGNYVILKHDDGFTTTYEHLDTFNVTEAEVLQRVMVAGEQVGESGKTGNAEGVSCTHLHLMVQDGKTPTEPLAWLAVDAPAPLASWGTPMPPAPPAPGTPSAPVTPKLTSQQ